MPRGQNFTPEFQRMARSHVKRESLQKSGRAGYDALCKKGKQKLAGQKAAQWRLEHPTNLERVIISQLTLLEMDYQREVSIDDFYTDFLIGKIAIEANGKQWHEKEELRQGQKQRDKRKYQTFANLGYTVIALPEDDILSGKTWQVLYKLFNNRELPF